MKGIATASIENSLPISIMGHDSWLLKNTNRIVIKMTEGDRALSLRIKQMLTLRITINYLEGERVVEHLYLVLTRPNGRTRLPC